MRGLFVSAAAVASLAAPVTAAAYATNSSCCSLLSHELHGKVWGKNTTSYQERLTEYYSANAALAPWCMVLPESTEDVSLIAQVISGHGCPFGMRSGAHSAWKGSNGVDHGITVDFGHMNATTYDESTKVASIQPGSDWKRVFDTLDPYGVVSVGGRASVVGVGGFTTGGGYSFHSNLKGFACDSVVNFEIVLANGTIINANANENADLWKAQKGGSGNFGFVTRIDQAVVEGTSMWGGLTSYDFENRDAVFNAYINFAENMDKDLASQNIISMSYGQGNFTLTSILTNIHAEDRAAAFDDYFVIPNISTTLRVAPVNELVPEFTGPTPLGLYANWFVGLSSNDFSVLNTVDLKLKEYVAKMRSVAPESDFEILTMFQPVTQSMLNHGEANGGNVLGLQAYVDDGPTIMWLVAVTIDTAANQDKLLPLAIELRNAINEQNRADGTFKDFSYLNYSWKDQNPISTYGEENIALIKAAADKYDPQAVFQKLRRSGFKIPA